MILSDWQLHISLFYDYDCNRIKRIIINKENISFNKIYLIHNELKYTINYELVMIYNCKDVAKCVKD